MPKANNPTIGNIPCDLCGKSASVKQNAKTYLYVGCQECGVDMRKGAKLQTRIYQEAEWLDGVAPVPPVNLITDKPSEAPACDSERLPDDRQNPKPEPTPEPKKESNRGGWAVLATLAAFIIIPFKGGM